MAEFTKSVVAGEGGGQTQFGDGAQRGERNIEGGCWQRDIMGTDSVEWNRSEQEFRFGTEGMLAKWVRASAAAGFLPEWMKTGLVATVAAAVGVHERVWLSKRG